MIKVEQTFIDQAFVNFKHISLLHPFSASTNSSLQIAMEVHKEVISFDVASEMESNEPDYSLSWNR
jgi:hypothetical protein